MDLTSHQQKPGMRWNYTSRDIANFSPKGDRERGWNEGKAVGFLEFLQDSIIESFDCKHVLFLRKGKSDLEGDLENIGAATLSTGPGGQRCFLLFQRVVTTESYGARALLQSCGVTVPLQWRMGHGTKENYSLAS